MSLKDEIEKFIRAERSKLEQKEVATKHYREKQLLRFQAMRRTLEEIAQSIAPEYLESEMDERDADISIGLRDATSGYFRKEISWHIEPNFRFGKRDEPSEGWLIEEPGFQVEETETHEPPAAELIENSHTFNNEAEVAQHMVPIIAKHVALHEHLKKRFSGRDPIPMPGPEDQ
jgi:hypothetical protein